MDDGTLAQVFDLLSLAVLLRVALLAIAAGFLLWLLRAGLERLTRRFPKYRLQLGRVYPVLRVAIWALVAVYVVFGLIKPPQAIVIAVLGSIGLAIGLAAQGGVRNLIAGIMIMFNPPFRVGDMVRFGGHYGEVTRLDLSVTWLRTLDDDTVMVPNAAILDSAVANSNSGKLSQMVVVRIDLPRAAPIRQLRALAREAAIAAPYCDLSKPVTVLVEARYDFDFLIQIVIKAYVVDVRLERRLASDITERFLEAIHTDGIVPPDRVAPRPTAR